MISTSAVLNAAATLLAEAFQGAGDSLQSWFTDNAPDAGLLGTLAALSAAQASVPMGAHPVGAHPGGGTTIAAHAEHLRWCFTVTNRIIRGEQPNVNWEESWVVTTVSDSEWNTLRTALGNEYEALHTAFLAQQTLPEEYLTPTFSVVAHAAYHLGAIRCMARQVQSA